jgi:hypothetical protein
MQKVQGAGRGYADAHRGRMADSREQKKVGTCFCLHFILFSSRENLISTILVKD